MILNMAIEYLYKKVFLQLLDKLYLYGIIRENSSKRLTQNENNCSN